MVTPFTMIMQLLELLHMLYYIFNIWLIRVFDFLDENTYLLIEVLSGFGRGGTQLFM